MGTRKTRAVMWVLALAGLLVACASSTASDGRVIEVTRIVERIVTATPIPPTARQVIDENQTNLASDLVEYLENQQDIESVNLVRMRDGKLEIELNTARTLKDSQAIVSWKLIRAVCPGFGDYSEDQLSAVGTSSRTFAVLLTTYSNQGDYRYKSETSYETCQLLGARAISYDEWIAAASAGFR